MMKTIWIAVASLCLGVSAGAQVAQQQAPLTTETARRLEELERAVETLSQQIGGLGNLLSASLPPLPVEDVEPFELSIGMSPIKGIETAKIALVEFSDFQCPFCGQNFRTAYPRLSKSFIDAGRIQYVFKHLPLEEIHPLARGAAEAAECAREQRGFWEMHDHMFRNQQALSRADLVKHSDALKFDSSLFGTCLKSEKPRLIVQRDIDEAKRLGLSGTPTFLLGEVTGKGTVLVRKKIVGSQSFEVFRFALDALLATAN